MSFKGFHKQFYKIINTLRENQRTPPLIVMAARNWITCYEFFTSHGGCNNPNTNTLICRFLDELPNDPYNNKLFVIFCFIVRIVMALGATAWSTASFAIATSTFSENPATVMVSWYTATYRVDSGFAPSQWQTALLCNDGSYWLGASLESALYIVLTDRY